MKKLVFVSILFVVFVVFVLLFLIRGSVTTKLQTVSTQVQNLQDTIVPVPTKITEAGLPDKHLIKTAFVPQAPEKNWDQPWQDACEEAALLTVVNYYKHQSPDISSLLKQYQDLYAYESSQGYGHDINISQISHISQDLYDLNSQIIDNPTIDDIRKHISQDIPVVVPANGKTLYKENKRFKSGGPWYHNIVILGYDDIHQQFIVHDVGTQFGAYFKYSYKLLISSIHDFPESGNKEDIDTGARRVLILLQ